MPCPSRPSPPVPGGPRPPVPAAAGLLAGLLLLVAAGSGAPAPLSGQGVGISAGGNFAGVGVGVDEGRMQAAVRSLRKRPGRTKYALPWPAVREALVVEGGERLGETIKIAILLVRLRDGRPVLARAGKVFVHDGRRTYPGDVFFSSKGILPRGAAVPADGIHAGGEIVPGRELLPRKALFDGGTFEPDARLIRKSVAGAGIDLEGREALWIAAVPAGTGARAETPVRPLVVLLDQR